ncbi:MAG TPA: Hsp20/alpha crystallin family protein [Thermohalobaculum sp.]|nr:Hsp20/alpha crystallin family protein [Thermohalobaculum sp.]
MQIKDLLPWARRETAGDVKATAEQPLAELQRQMNAAFESFWRGAERPFGGLDLPVGGEGVPRSDVVETADGIEISVELPGMEQGDVEVSLAGDSLTIKGEKKIEKQEEKRGYYVSERSYGSVYRTIPLPPGVDTDKAEATFRNGVLTVKLPQTAEAKEKVKRVEVKSA